MDIQAIENMLKSFRNTFFTGVLATACQLAAIVTILLLSKKEKLTYWFLLYCSVAFVLFVTFRFAIFFITPGRFDPTFLESSNILFAFVEYAAFYQFFKKLFEQRMVLLFMKLFYVVFTIVVLHFFYKLIFTKMSDSVILEYSDFIISLELLVLGAFCLVYYFRLLRQKPKNRLSQSPAFWIITGLFFYSFVITPFFMIITPEFMDSRQKIYNLLFTLHYISFSFLFIAIIKAFFLKKPLTA